jgi:hypothetical protein
MPYNVPPSPKIYLRYYDLCHKLAWGFSSALCLNSHGCCQEPKVVALHGIQTGCSRNNSRCKINSFVFQFGQPRSPKFPDYDTIFCSFALDYLKYICYYFCNLRLLYSVSPFSLADLGIRGFGGLFLWFIFLLCSKVVCISFNVWIRVDEHSHHFARTVGRPKSYGNLSHSRVDYTLLIYLTSRTSGLGYRDGFPSLKRIWFLTRTWALFPSAGYPFQTILPQRLVRYRTGCWALTKVVLGSNHVLERAL